MANPSPTKAKGDVPKYRVTEKCYLGGILHDPELMPYARGEHGEALAERIPLVVEFPGIPGPYMQPANAAARDMIAKHRPQHNDPIEALTIVGAPGAVDIKDVLSTAKG